MTSRSETVVYVVCIFDRYFASGPNSDGTIQTAKSAVHARWFDSLAQAVDAAGPDAVIERVTIITERIEAER